MDIGPRERGELSIPSFASERCRAMAASLVRVLDDIPPLDDGALEDRALACFLVACGELGLMSSTTHRDEVVEQLTVVARKLVKANAESSKPKAPKNQAQALAEALMRGVVRGAARVAAKGPSLQPAQRPILDISVDPPAIPAGSKGDQPAQERNAQDNVPPREGGESIDETRTGQAESAQAETIEVAQAKPAVGAQSPATQQPSVQAKTIQIQQREEKVTREKIKDAAQVGSESHAALSWDELETLMKKEVAEIAPGR